VVCQHCGAVVDWVQWGENIWMTDEEKLVEYKAVCTADCASFRSSGEALSAASNRRHVWESRY
jgi:hypothetical protein